MEAICTMMDAVMYGITFSANMLNRCKAPPENMLNMPSRVPFWVEKKAANRAASIPGTGMNVPIRYTTRAPSRNHRRLRISAKRVMSPRAAVGLVVATAFLNLEAPAGRLDRALGTLGRRDRLVLDDVGLGDRARNDDLHELRGLGHQIRFDQARQGDFPALDPHQIAQGQLSPRRLHGGTEADLGQSPLQGHLAAFESYLVIAALARALPLDPAAAGFTLAGGCTAADPQTGLLGAGTRLDGVQSHGLNLPRTQCSLNFEHVAGRIDHAAIRRGVRNHDAVADTPQSQAAGRVADAGQLAKHALDQSDLDCLVGHGPTPRVPRRSCRASPRCRPECAAWRAHPWSRAPH